MCRYSFHTYESYLGLAGNPVEWKDMYMLSDPEPEAPQQEPGLPFAHYQDRVRDLTPRRRELPPGSHPFPVQSASLNSILTFNIASYSRQLLNDFLLEGGKIERVELHTPSELSQIPQKVIINATGYGARALWKDESIVPVRGQIAWLIPQPELNYGLMYRGVFMLPRRDGIVVQSTGNGEMEGYNDANEVPDRAAAEAAVGVIAGLYARMKR
jgi:glycine/D-amino acid oxidase-like deaminating enzyme